MTNNFKKEDMRIIKTHKALLDAMSLLLRRRNFSQITVNDLCVQAQISRTTFYAHFDDKYNLLKYWLENSKPKSNGKEDPHAQMRKAFDYFIHDAKVVKNIVEDANRETLELLHKFMVSLLNIDMKEKEGEDADDRLKRDVLSAFCSGGMISFLERQIKGGPEHLQKANDHFFEILAYALKWGQ